MPSGPRPTIYRHTFTDRTEVRIPGAQHQLGTSRLSVFADGQPVPYARIDPVTHDVRIVFARPLSGTIQLVAARE